MSWFYKGFPPTLRYFKNILTWCLLVLLQFHFLHLNLFFFQWVRDFCNEWPHLSFPQMVTPLSQHHWLNHPITPSHPIIQFNKHKPLYSIYTSALSAWNPACLPHCFNYSSSVVCLFSLGVTSLPSPITLFGICSLFLGCLFSHVNFQIHLSFEGKSHFHNFHLTGIPLWVHLGDSIFVDVESSFPCGNRPGLLCVPQG